MISWVHRSFGWFCCALAHIIIQSVYPLFRSFPIHSMHYTLPIWTHDLDTHNLDTHDLDTRSGHTLELLLLINFKMSDLCHLFNGHKTSFIYCLIITHSYIVSKHTLYINMRKVLMYSQIIQNFIFTFSHLW